MDSSSPSSSRHATELRAAVVVGSGKLGTALGPTSSAPPASAAPAGACNATYRTVNSWNGGFQGEVTVTAGSSAINGWTVRWTLSSGQTITQVWNGTLSASGSAVSVSNAVLQRQPRRIRVDDLRLPGQRHIVDSVTDLHQPLMVVR